MSEHRPARPRFLVCRLSNMKAMKFGDTMNLNLEKSYHRHHPNPQTQVRQNPLNFSQRLDVDCSTANNTRPSLFLRFPRMSATIKKAVRKNPSERATDPCDNS